MIEIRNAINDAVDRHTKTGRWRRPFLDAARRQIDSIVNERNKMGIPMSILKMSDDEISTLREQILRYRDYRSLQVGRAVNMILNALEDRGLYQGQYLNAPVQIDRKNVMDFRRISGASEKGVNALDAYLSKFKDIASKQKKKNNKDETLKSTQQERPSKQIYKAFCAFFASATLDGAVAPDFYRKIFNITRTDVTFNPFTIIAHNYPSQQIIATDEQYAYARYWLSERTAIYFLRLLLLIAQHRKELHFRYSGNYLMPDEWRKKKVQAQLESLYRLWLGDVMKQHGLAANDISSIGMRLNSMNNLLKQTPCFIASTLKGAMQVGSFSFDDLRLLDTELDKALHLSFRDGKKVRNNHEIEVDVKDQGEKKSIKKFRFNRVQASDQLEANEKKLRQNSGFFEMLADITALRLSGKKKSSRKERIAIADAFLALAKLCRRKARKHFCFENLSRYCCWLADCFVNIKLTVKSIQIYASELERTFLVMLGQNSIMALDKEQFIKTIWLTRLLYDSGNIFTAIRSFTEYVEAEEDLDGSEKKWSSSDWFFLTGKLRDMKKTKPLVTVEHVKRLLDLIPREMPENSSLRVAIILGFYGGLRISEITHLDKNSLIIDGGWVLRIRESKSSNGIRNVPLSYLIPKKELDEIVEFFRKARRGQNKGTWLFALKDPRDSAIDYSHAVGQMFKDIGLEFYRFHHLRHAFVNWFLLRWVAGIQGADIFPASVTFLHDELFEANNLLNLRRLVAGFNDDARNQVIVHVLPVLAKLIGHGGPVTTVTNYVHIADYLYFRMRRDRFTPKSEHLSSSAIQNMLQLSYPALPAELRKIDQHKVPLSTIIRHQAKRLDFKMNAANARPVPR